MLWLQCVLFLALYFEPPGPIDPDTNSLKSISDAIRLHNGLALAVFACAAWSEALVCWELRPCARFASMLAFFVAQLGALGVVLFPDDQTGDGHDFYAALAIVGPLALNALLVAYGEWQEARAWLLALGAVAGVIMVVAVASVPAAIGPSELVVLASLWGTWVTVNE